MQVIPIQNRAAPLILEYIEANPQATAPEAAAALQMDKRKVEGNVKRLMEWGLIHISGYVRPRGAGKIARMFVAGPGKNAVMPKTSPAQSNRLKLEWAQRKRAQDAVINGIAKYGVFGVVASQLERRT